MRMHKNTQYITKYLSALLGEAALPREVEEKLAAGDVLHHEAELVLRLERGLEFCWYGYRRRRKEKQRVDQ